MEFEVYSMENLRIVSAICSLLGQLALPVEVDRKLIEVDHACAKHMEISNLLPKRDPRLNTECI